MKRFEGQTPRSILLVDDHTLFREGLKVLVEQSPLFEVAAEVGAVEAALATLPDIKPDMVLMDIALPDINGIEGTRLILEKRPATKVIVISMYSKMDYITAALQAGASGYLVKDTTHEMLLQALEIISRGHYFFDHRSLEEIVGFILEQKEMRPSITEKNYDRLTRREQEVMRLVAQGLTSKDIAEELGISPKTVENHRTKIMEKLEMDSLVDLVKYAAKLGIINIP